MGNQPRNHQLRVPCAVTSTSFRCGKRTLLEGSESRDEEYQQTTSSSSKDETPPRSARLPASSKRPKVLRNFVKVDLCPQKDLKFQPLERSSWVDNMKILHHSQYLKSYLMKSWYLSTQIIPICMQTYVEGRLLCIKEKLS